MSLARYVKANAAIWFKALLNTSIFRFLTSSEGSFGGLKSWIVKQHVFRIAYGRTAGTRGPGAVPPRRNGAAPSLIPASLTQCVIAPLASRCSGYKAACRHEAGV